MYEGHRLGNFLCGRLLGRGGMGIVHEAVEDITGRSVALKIMTKAAAADRGERSRFERERQAIAQMNHPGVPTCAGWGEVDGMLWMAMELIRGSTLHDLAATPMHPQTAIGYGLAVASILDSCYRTVGMVHRDIKPGNIMVSGETTNGMPLVRLIDYGLALFQDIPDGENFGERYVYTGTHTPKDIAGTPAYMPPEQWIGGDMDCRSDIYAIGVMLYRLVTGRLPYTANVPARFLIAHRDAPIPDPAALITIGGGLSACIMRCMAKEQQGRYRGYEALMTALRTSLHEEMTRERRGTHAVFRTDSTAPSTTSIYRRPVTGSGWRRPSFDQSAESDPFERALAATVAMTSEALEAATMTYDPAAFGAMMATGRAPAAAGKPCDAIPQTRSTILTEAGSPATAATKQDRRDIHP
jgi:serine/threonine protein kinase